MDPVRSSGLPLVRCGVSVGAIVTVSFPWWQNGPYSSLSPLPPSSATAVIAVIAIALPCTTMVWRRSFVRAGTCTSLNTMAGLFCCVCVCPARRPFCHHAHKVYPFLFRVRCSVCTM
ncbi:MAG: hypothetical protein J3Q66DRAFT_357081, partial [Benniella sp.]